MNCSLTSFGNWIFLNFPYDNEIWSILHEQHILQDSSPQLEALQKRWYKLNRIEIDREIYERHEREATERRIRAEEER
jgi:hypothetical protein